jgi:pSer/pThr/pTyr-binding forkhead associated (FHA) protein
MGGAPAIDPNPASRVLRAFLLSYQNNPQGDFWPLLGGRMTVGRANAGDGIEVQLADATISSRHAAFLVDNVSGGFNGRRDLKDGDRVRFGGFTTIIKVIGRV